MDHATARRRASSKPHTEESGTSGTTCTCALCKLEIRSPSPRAGEVLQLTSGAEEKSFTWLLQRLAEASELNDLVIPIPETVVYRHSRPAFQLQQSKDGFLRGILVPDKIKKEEIIRSFTNIVRARKKDDLTTPSTPFGKLSKALNRGPTSSETSAYGKEIALVRYFAKGFDNEATVLRPQDEEGPVRVTMESEFFEMMFERGGSSLWRSLVYVQTVLKSKVGLNEVMYVNYDARSPAKKPQTSEARLMKRQPEEYCRLVMQRIAVALRDYANYEVLSMEGQFIKDDNGAVWLHYLRRVYVKLLPYFRPPRQDETRPAEGERLDAAEITEVKVPMDSLNPNSTRIVEMLHGLFEETKSRSGIESIWKNKPKNVDTNEAFARLRPHCKFSFDEIMEGPSITLPKNRSRVSSAHGGRRIAAKRALNASIDVERSADKLYSTWQYRPKFKLRPFRQSTRSLASQ
jgi:hypothetical protein